jgi:hypothetical protein
LLSTKSPGAGRSGLHCDPLRDAIQPRPDRIPRPHARCSSGKDQESRLESILGILLVPQDPPADGQDHRTVPLDQNSEGRFILVGKKRIENLAI